LERIHRRIGRIAVGIGVLGMTPLGTAQGEGSTQTASDSVRVCQVGYLPSESKVAMLTAAPTGEVVVRTPEGKAILTVKAAEPQLDPDSGDTIRKVDFSSLKKAGEYYLDVPGVGRSYAFRIGNDVFAKTYRIAMRAFTGQRCGTAVSLAPDFPQYHYDACHTELAQYDPSSGKTGAREVLGGWHDAGDFGRYIVNSGITTGTLLWAYELNAGKLKKVGLDIPESGNGTPDTLNEIRWNLTWMLKMQDDDGGVWHKSTSARFCGFVMPKEDTSPVLVIGNGKEPFKTTTSTADFAAVCAIAGRVYRPFDDAFATKCRVAATKAWKWLAANPDNNFTNNPRGIATGGYGDNDPSDERLWAAAELFRTTGEADYNKYFLEHYGKWSPTIKGEDPQGWPTVGNLAMFTYALAKQRSADKAAVAKIKADAIAAADAMVARSQVNGYRLPMLSRDYIWGSNAVVANYGMVLRLAHRFQPKQAYVNAAQDCLHYLLGRNAFNTSFVTWAGTKWAKHPHHRPSGADGIDEPWPGMLVGGPNANGKNPPARQWFDDQNDFRTNEIAINWNAPLVFLLAEAQK